MILKNHQPLVGKILLILYCGMFVGYYYLTGQVNTPGIIFTEPVNYMYKGKKEKYSNVK